MVLDPLTVQELSQAYQRKLTVLVVDDVIEVLDTLEGQLTQLLDHHYGVERAESGEEALSLVRELLQGGQELALVISDLKMERMMGDELLVQIHKLSPDTVTIMLTGQAMLDGNGTEGLQRVTNAVNNAHLYRYIEKPWEKVDLQRTVEEGLKSYLQEQRIREHLRTLRLLHEAAAQLVTHIHPEELYLQLVKAALAYSGADKAALVLQQEAGWMVVALATLTTSTTEGKPLVGYTALPADWLLAAAERGLPSIVSDAGSELSLLSNPYVLQHHSKALLAYPLLHHSKNLGMLYLESSSQRGLFTPEKLEVLGILAAQAAIALENVRIYAGLEEAVFLRTQQLLATNSHKDEVVRIVSHDIRSPLTGIQSLANLLQDPEVAAEASEVVKYGAMIVNSTKNVLKLVNDILDTVKLEGDTFKVQYTTVRLREFLNAVCSAAQPQAVAKNITLELTVPPAMEATVDESKLGQALNNLISNALKFTPRGGSVYVNAQLTTTAGKQWVSIQVRDTGMGIPAEQLPRMFEKFGARQRAGTEGEKGTGLGMSIVHRLVQLQGGTIQVSSVVGQGTTFTLLLPQVA